jgi:broad specificity phosphatase PhoE
MVKRVHLVRHGRTKSNVEQRSAGWNDESILPPWRAAAEAVADALADEHVDRFVASPVTRAVETAQPFAQRLGREPELDDRFGELHVGPWKGHLESDIAETWPDEWRIWRTTPHLLKVEGRETLQELNARVGAALDELVDSLPESGTAVVFTHDAVVRAAVAWALGVGPEIYGHVRVANCSISTVALAGVRRELERSNDVGHLAGLALDE